MRFIAATFVSINLFYGIKPTFWGFYILNMKNQIIILYIFHKYSMITVVFYKTRLGINLKTIEHYKQS